MGEDSKSAGGWVRNDSRYVAGGTGKDDVLPVSLGFIGVAEVSLLVQVTTRFGDGDSMSWTKGNNLMVRHMQDGQDCALVRGTQISSQVNRMVVLSTHCR